MITELELHTKEPILEFREAVQKLQVAKKNLLSDIAKRESELSYLKSALDEMQKESSSAAQLLSENQFAQMRGSTMDQTQFKPSQG